VKTASTKAPNNPNSLLARFSDSSPIIKVAIGGGIFLAVYFLAIDPMLGKLAAWNTRADQKAASLAEYGRKEQAMKAARDAVVLGRGRFGTVSLPEDIDTRSSAFNTEVDEILGRWNLEQLNVSTKSTSMANGTLTKAVPSDQKVDRLTKDVQFVSTPETAAMVIAELEQSPLVSAVSRVQLRTGEKGARKVRTQLAVETWVTKRKDSK
jgi:hypothetical protein